MIDEPFIIYFYKCVLLLVNYEFVLWHSRQWTYVLTFTAFKLWVFLVLIFWWSVGNCWNHHLWTSIKLLHVPSSIQLRLDVSRFSWRIIIFILLKIWFPDGGEELRSKERSNRREYVTFPLSMLSNGRDINGNDRIIQKNSSILHGGLCLRNGLESIVLYLPFSFLWCFLWRVSRAHLNRNTCEVFQKLLRSISELLVYPPSPFKAPSTWLVPSLVKQ